MVVAYGAGIYIIAFVYAVFVPNAKFGLICQGRLGTNVRITGRNNSSFRRR
jgi:hypothetical protein